MWKWHGAWEGSEWRGKDTSTYTSTFLFYLLNSFQPFFNSLVLKTISPSSTKDMLRSLQYFFFFLIYI